MNELAPLSENLARPLDCSEALLHHANLDRPDPRQSFVHMSLNAGAAVNWNLGVMHYLSKSQIG